MIRLAALKTSWLNQPIHLRRATPQKAGESRLQHEPLDVTTVLVFGVTSIGLGGYSLISLLGIIGMG